MGGFRDLAAEDEGQALLQVPVSRRAFLTRGLMAGAALACAPVLLRPAEAASPARRLAFRNLHTEEEVALVYWKRGAYVPSALAAFNRVLRDHRTGDVHKMDPKLFDLLARIQARLGSAGPFEVISGYRSPQSNAMLHAQSSGVAHKSMHVQGKAIDVRLADRSLAALHEAALAMRGGGVGYYPTSNFVHVDTGRLRRWDGV